MADRDPLHRLAARLARGAPIDWDAEERAAATEDERAGIRKLRIVAALSIVNRSLLSGVSHEDLSSSVSEAKKLSGRRDSETHIDHSNAPAPSLPPHSRWGQIEILEHAGGGSFGEVYRARDTRLDREVALKILHGDTRGSQDEVVREARLLARVRHPNVVTVYGADQIDGRIGLWTEFLRGQTLDRMLQERGVLDAREAALIGIDLCRALSAVHAAGIVHQDVKLTNVMRVEGGRIVLMDFGLGRELDSRWRRRGSLRAITGTPLFMAPEVMAGAPSDARSDLYSLGVVLFALVTASVPIEASTLDELRGKHDRGERREVRDLRPDLGSGFVHLLQKFLAPDPKSRYQTAGEAERALYSALESPSEAPQRPATTRAQMPPHRLPAEIDSFVGREEDMRGLQRIFLEGARLVTLQGPGGMGKTRLAVRHGWTTLGDWSGGVWFCDLTEAKSRDGIASAVGEGLGVPLGPGDPIEQLGHAIASRGTCLVILDNFEQVIDHAAETVATWLVRAPDARFVVTSRERLKLSGEVVQSIEPLPIARGMELFADRARRQRPIELDGPEADSVRELVRLLEGIPLAIELSAARLRVLTPAQIADRIAERFRVVASAGTGRHATLRTAIDGSWELLPAWEKAAFAQCAMFEGGFSFEAAEGVLDLGASGAPWIVDVLQSLVDKSLLRSWVSEAQRSSTRPAVRFGMFVSLQEYAREKLAEPGSIPDGASGPEAVAAAERSHAHWFARYGKDDGSAVADPVDDTHSGGLEAELDNMIAACRRMATHGDGETAVWCYRAAWSLLVLRGPLAVAIDLGRQVLHSALTCEQRSLVSNLLGQAEQRSGRMQEALRHYEESLAIDRTIGNRKGEGRTLARLASLALNEGRTLEANAQHEAALAIHREVDDRRAEGITLGNLGLALHEQGRLDEASLALEASLQIHREVGNRRSEGIVLGNLGDLRVAQGRVDDARSHFESALLIHREVGNRRFEGIVLGNLGSLARKLGRMEEARGHFEAALAIHREVGSRRFEGHALDSAAHLSLAMGNREEALRQFEAALAIHREVGNRRGEGIVLGRISMLVLEEDRIERAQDLLAQAVALLKAPDYRMELGKVLCTRADLELRIGNREVALGTLAEIETIVAYPVGRRDIELEGRLEDLRDALSTD